MGIFNQSSSPLSTLMPQSSPYKMPDYSNAFKMNNQMQMNNLKFRTGLLTSNSSDLTTALNGKNMMNDAMNPNYQDTLLLQNTNNGTTGGASFNWDLGFNALSLIGGLIGGLAGNVLNSAGKIGSSIRIISQANKGIKDGIAGASKAKAGGIGAVVGAASDLIGSFMPLKTEYEGDKGDIIQTMDSVYDGISDAAMFFEPAGMLVSGIMKGGALLGKGMNALGGGTSGMTTTDAILGSSFLNLTPLGLVNGFGGLKADTITKDNEAFAQVGSSYTGSESTVNDALTKSGKKYGLLSSGAREKANREIAEAKRLQSIISNISDDMQDRTAIRTSMSAINGNRKRLQMQGGYDLAAIRVGRRGMSLELLEKAKSIIKAQLGTKTSDPFLVYLLSLPENLRDSSNYRVRDYWEFNGRPRSFLEALTKGMFTKQKDGYHARSVMENPKTGEIEYMKAESHPTRYMESDWYEKGLVYNDDGTATLLQPGVEGYEDWKDFTSNYELLKTSPYWKYVRRKTPIKLETPQHKNGGSIITLVKESVIELVNPDDIPEFKNGGSINVIPDGALHARKHNMDLEGITEKGIPVVSNGEDGKVEQLAEIEKEEVIFRLEVTQKLEELEKKYYSDETSLKEKDELALEAGKLITKELLHNTKDNAGLL